MGVLKWNVWTYDCGLNVNVHCGELARVSQDFLLVQVHQ